MTPALSRPPAKEFWRSVAKPNPVKRTKSLRQSHKRRTLLQWREQKVPELPTAKSHTVLPLTKLSGKRSKAHLVFVASHPCLICQR